MSQVSTDRRFGVISSSAIKVPVKAATTANITLSGEQTIDGISCVTDDRVLVQNQTTASENGIYTVDTGSWERAIDFNGTYDVVEGTIIPVNRGTVYGIRGRRITNTGTITIGTTSLTFGDTLYSSSSGIEFVQSGIGAVATDLQTRGRLEVWAEDFGAVGDGVTDDTAFIQAAIDHVSTRGGTIRFAEKTYLVTSLVLKSGVYLKGMGSGKRLGLGSLTATTILGTAGSDIITFEDASVSDVALLGLQLSGGRRHVYYEPSDIANRALANFWIEDLHFRAASAECIYIGGQSERQFFKYIYFANGTYGYFHCKGNKTFGLFEKSTWEHIYCEGQSINAVCLSELNTSGALHFNFVKVISSGENAWRIQGRVSNTVFTALSFESCCTTGNSTNTTGTISSASDSLVVASATGFSEGDSITIRGAGASGADLTTTITTIAGTTFTLAASASTSVTSEFVTNREFDIISFESLGGVGNAEGIVFVGGNLLDASTSKARYGINNTGGWAREILLLGTGGSAGGQTGTPSYDPTARITAVAAPASIRVAYSGVRPAFQRGETISFPNGRGATTGEYPPTTIGTPRGKDCAIFLNDSAGNGTGTVGDLLVYPSVGTPAVALKFDGDNFQFSTRNKIHPGNYATGSGSSPSLGTKGFIYGNAVPTAGTWVLGDVVVNASPAIGEAFLWRCTVAGTPGTWVADRNRGTFTMDADASTTVTEADCTTTSVIVLMPTNASAGTLVGSASSPFVTPAAGSFQVDTADGGNAAGTETFSYMILN